MLSLLLSHDLSHILSCQLSPLFLKSSSSNVHLGSLPLSVLIISVFFLDALPLLAIQNLWNCMKVDS